MNSPRAVFPPAAFLSLALFLARGPLIPAQQPDRSRRFGELVLRSYQLSFPDKIEALHWSDNDWTIQVGDTIFYWAEGRLLPATFRAHWRSYRPHSFSLYPAAIPDPAQYSREQLEALRRLGGLESQDQEEHNRSFQAALYGGMTRREIERNLRRMVFLGRRVTVHPLIEAPLGRIDAAVRAAAAEDREVAAFLAALRSIGAYNWREIQGTQRMSYHSWGLAVDILCTIPSSIAVYWRWERARTDDWMLIPPDKRWQPPDPVIRAFEKEGFIWGGKWALFDAMHFEYRPELHELNRLMRAGEDAIPLIQAGAFPDLHHLFPEN
jgi:hypothetical protein